MLRDYSGSMGGKPTELVVSQHVLIYSWLLYQYGGQVETRFILHDTEAREVDDFYTYYNSQVAGGTKVASAFALMNEIVRRRTWPRTTTSTPSTAPTATTGTPMASRPCPRSSRRCTYAARVGVTITERSSAPGRESRSRST